MSQSVLREVAASHGGEERAAQRTNIVGWIGTEEQDEGTLSYLYHHICFA